MSAPLTPVEPLLTITEAARQAGLPHWTLRRAVAAGDVPAVRIGRRRRVRLSAVLAAFLAA